MKDSNGERHRKSRRLRSKRIMNLIFWTTSLQIYHKKRLRLKVKNLNSKIGLKRWILRIRLRSNLDNSLCSLIGCSKNLVLSLTWKRKLRFCRKTIQLYISNTASISAWRLRLMTTSPSVCKWKNQEYIDMLSTCTVESFRLWKFRGNKACWRKVRAIETSKHHIVVNMELPGDAKYAGECLDGEAHGKGIIRYDDGVQG